ncbi:DUF4348 domain-containing protein [Cellulophaga sp. HaHa_2_95]|uniref:DUF4348 domain-containing protein n=1 Tax=Cellulophaga sp. HaHa_2_95 TaxID=2745558 RepID=UPI001C4EF75E|nr:DUF4348 domain-containing protein [Cellulophaga sp. HaHa_2_95]QXP57758.1 DUF4348 domain-containing protein [Cellulophaga sp. HaHa_2_95]
MKTIKLLTFGTLIFTFLSCKQNGKTQKKIEQNEILDSITINQINVPENVDLEFEVFLKYFNQDSVFQISRVRFPVKSKELDSDYYVIDKIVKKDDYKIIDLTIDPNSETKQYNKYRQQTILKDFEAKIEIRGIDNGIHQYYEFEKIEGKWNLTTWGYLST